MRRGPLIVAHRGASASEAENTIAAFEAAVAAGADAVEFDVRMTADGVAVVMHDADVVRTTTDRGSVRDLSIRTRSRAPDPAPRRRRAREVPTLDEALASLSGRIGVDIEIKNIPGEPDFDAEREPAVEATLRRARRRRRSPGRSLLSSFNPFSIAQCPRARADDPDRPADADRRSRPTSRSASRASRATRGCCPFAAWCARRVRGSPTRAHAAGLRLGTWIVDDPAGRVGLMRAGVDAVATNDPAALVRPRGPRRSARDPASQAVPPELEAPFARVHRVLAEVEPAKAALTDVMPTTRLPGRPLPDALVRVRRRGSRARRPLMPGWRVPAGRSRMDRRATRAWSKALERARRLREEAPDLGGFEGLIWAVEQLMDPLGAVRGRRGAVPGACG